MFSKNDSLNDGVAPRVCRLPSRRLRDWRNLCLGAARFASVRVRQWGTGRGVGGGGGDIHAF